MPFSFHVDSSSSSPSRRCRVTSVPATGPLRRLHRELARAVALPADRLARRQPGAPRHDRHPVRDDEARVEADAELADQLRVLLLVARELREELARARLRDRAEVLDGFGARKPDAVVGDGDRAGRLVERDRDRQLAVSFEQFGPGHRLEAQLVARVRGVADQLAQEDLLVAVQRVDHQLQQLLHFGLETQCLLRGRGLGVRPHRCSFRVVRCCCPSFRAADGAGCRRFKRPGRRPAVLRRARRDGRRGNAGGYRTARPIVATAIVSIPSTRLVVTSWRTCSR